MKEMIDKVYDCAYEVRRNLGPGYLENVYKNALYLELKMNGLDAEMEVPVKVMYKGHCVGDYRADMVVDNSLIIELKAVSNVLPVHEIQLVSYLTAMRIDDGVLINFGENYAFRHKTRTYCRRNASR